MDRCPRCARRAVVRWSDAIGARVCERCYGSLAPKPTATRALPHKRPKPYQPTAFVKFHGRVWDRLELLTDSPIFLMGVCEVACYCPRCLDGTMVVRFRDAERPLITITHGVGRDGCSLGCTEREIGEVLFH